MVAASGLGQKKPVEKHESIEKVIMDMQVKLQELDSIREELKKEQYTGISPQKSREMLEELVVPSLELIREEKKQLAKAH